LPVQSIRNALVNTVIAMNRLRARVIGDQRRNSSRLSRDAERQENCRAAGILPSPTAADLAAN
jgi:hypothetical protein